MLAMFVALYRTTRDGDFSVYVEEAYRPLADELLDELKIGTARMRRKLKRVGCESLAEAFSMEDDYLDEVLDWDEADVILALRKDYDDAPDTFFTKLAGRKSNASKARSQAIEQALGTQSFERTIERTTKPPVRRYLRESSVVPPLPPLESCRVLTACQARAASSFDELADEYDTFMAFQAFVEFANDFDDIAAAFGGFFRTYHEEVRRVLDLIDAHLGDVFVLYVADRARRFYDDGNLWGRLFGDIGIADANVQTDFKALFVTHLERRGMPTYDEEEESFYYLYTAVLHGGLSLGAWEDLWSTVFLPLAWDETGDRFGFAGEADGMAVLEEIKDSDSHFTPKKSVLSVLEKASPEMIAPLFDAALDVASCVRENEQASKLEGMTMLPSFDLPDVAMQALRNEIEPKGSYDEPGIQKPTKRKRLVYLPSGKLVLDLESIIVKAHWSRQQFPPSFAAERVEFNVNGRAEAIVELERYADKCILEEVNLPLPPRASYEIEIRLVGRNEAGDDVELASMTETFRRSKPWCFEFVQESSGMYRLRGRGEKIARARRVAYLVTKGMRVVPICGMSKVTQIEPGGAWGNADLFVFDVEPGASGRLVDGATGREYLAWHERYVAKTDSRKQIGKTVDGLDLYGFEQNELGTNSGLPSFSVESATGDVSMDDLDVLCECDGMRVAIPRRAETHRAGADVRSRLVIEPSLTMQIPVHVNRCTVEVRQKNAGGALVFKYTFAVAPVKDFHIERIAIMDGCIKAEYGFTAGEHLYLIDDSGHTLKVRKGVAYSRRTPLEDEVLPVYMESCRDGKKTNALLDLAGIEVVVPDGALKIAAERPVCLIDALDARPDVCRIKVRAKGRRKGRHVLAMLGNKPLLYSNSETPGERSINLHSRLELFVPRNFEMPKYIPLGLSISFGSKSEGGTVRPAWADINLLSCYEGLGFSTWALKVVDHALAIVFDSPVVGDVFIEFSLKVGGSIIGGFDIEQGTAVFPLPSEVCAWLRKRRKVNFKIMPTLMFGDPEREYATEYRIDR